MNNQMTVTVSDISGIKQYNFPANIKKILFSVLFIIIIMIGSLFFYVKTLNDKVVALDKTNRLLIADNKEEKILKQELAKKRAELEGLMNEKLIQKRIYEDKIAKIVSNKNKIISKQKIENEKQFAETLISTENKLAKVENKLAEANKKLKILEIDNKRKLAEQIKIKNELKKQKSVDVKLKKELVKKQELEKKERLAKKKKELERKKIAKAKLKKELEKKKAEKLKNERLAKEKAKKKKLAKSKKESKKHKITKRESQLPSIAKKNLGRRYVWGAVGPKTFDCSGFTSYVYRKKGIHIPRTSREQAKFGQYVKRNHLKPGDLIFFDTSRRLKGVVNHVGMYIGNNKFIHASSAKKRVVISSLDKTFYGRRYKLARRILN